MPARAVRARQSGITLGGGWFKIGDPLGVAVVDRADEAPMWSAWRSWIPRQRPAEFLDQPVRLAMVTPRAGRDAVLPGVRAALAARDDVIDRVSLGTAISAQVIVPAHERGPGERYAAAVRHPHVPA